jgi:molybdate transport system permease protein
MSAMTPAREIRGRNLSVGLTWVFGPAALLCVLFLGVPIAAIVWRAMRTGALADNLTSSFVLDAMRLSAITSTFTLAIAIVIGTPLAYLLARYDFPGKALVDLIVDLPVVLPPTVAGVALLVTLGRRGIIGEHLQGAGIDIAFTATAVVLAQLFVAAPFYIRTVKAGFETVDPAYERLAWTLGASPWRAFRRITLPLAWPSILAGAVLCWARALSELGATLIFAGSYQGRTQTMPLAIIGAFESGKSIDVPIALAVILIITAAALLAILRLIAGSVPAQGPRA